MVKKITLNISFLHKRHDKEALSVDQAILQLSQVITLSNRQGAKV